MKNGLLLICLYLSLAVQNDGTISGTVKDNNGAAIAGAAITIVNPAKNIKQTVTTNNDGIFVSPQLPPGKYTIKVEKSGFKKVEKSDITLITSDKLNVGEFLLDVGDVTETV